MKKIEIIIIVFLSLISIGITVYFYITLFQTPKTSTTQKQQIDFPSPISEETVSKPSTFLGTIFSKVTPTPPSTPTPILLPKSATEYMGMLEKSYTDGGKTRLNSLKTDASKL